MAMKTNKSPGGVAVSPGVDRQSTEYPWSLSLYIWTYLGVSYPNGHRLNASSSSARALRISDSPSRYLDTWVTGRPSRHYRRVSGPRTRACCHP